MDGICESVMIHSFILQRDFFQDEAAQQRKYPFSIRSKREKYHNRAKSLLRIDIIILCYTIGKLIRESASVDRQNFESNKKETKKYYIKSTSPGDKGK
jgi:hypothetical protein